MNTPLDRISIELTRRCAKGCWFCYNGSNASGETSWDVASVVDFVLDCAAHGVEACSLGGGEPLQFEGWAEILAALDGRVFRSVTTNGLLLRDATFDALVKARPDKVHLSIHFPGRFEEVRRVIAQVRALEGAGIRSGVNLLVARSRLADAGRAAAALRHSGIDNKRIVYLPMRMQDTPSAAELAQVAGGPFQSMSCLPGCAKSARFASVGADRTVAWCSYTTARRPLAAPTWAALMEALVDLELKFCGPEPEPPLPLTEARTP